MPRFILLSVICCLLAACSSSSERGPLWQPDTYSLEMVSSGVQTETGSMEVGDYLVLKVRDPINDGFALAKPEFDETRLALESFRYIPPAEKAVFGAFGRYVYSFTALKAGKTTIFMYKYNPLKDPKDEVESIPYKQADVTVTAP